MAGARPPADETVDARGRISRLVHAAGVLSAVLLAGYGLWLGLVDGAWMTTGLFGLFAYAAYTVGKAASCAIAMRV